MSSDVDGRDDVAEFGTTCPSCGEVADLDQVFCGRCGSRLTQPVGTAVGSETVAPSSGERPRNHSRFLAPLTIIALVFGMAGTGLSIFTLTRDAPKSQVTVVEGQLSALKQRVRSVNSEIANVATQKSVSGITTKLSKLEQCVPEVQTEIDDLTVGGTYYGSTSNPPAGFDGQVAGWPLTVSTSEQVSPECSSLFYP
jgi:ribosomal protein S27AE